MDTREQEYIYLHNIMSAANDNVWAHTHVHIRDVVGINVRSRVLQHVIIQVRELVLTEIKVEIRKTHRHERKQSTAQS